MSRKKIKEIIVSGVSIGLMAAILVGCGTNGDSGSKTASSAEAETSDGKVYTLSMQSHENETGPIGTYLKDWAAAVEEASDGRLKINIFHGGSLGSGTESYNMVTSGQVDLAYGLPSMTNGKFPLTDVASLPLTAQDTVQASYALWDLYESSEALQDEWSEVKVILLNANCDSPLLIKGNKIETVSEMKGLQTRYLGDTSTSFAKKIGMVPMSVAISDIYTSLEKGVIDGVANCGWDAVSSYRLYEQVDYICDWHLNINPLYIVMNKDVYEGLPEDLQQVIDDYSGYKALEIIGTTMQDVRTDTIAQCQEKIYTLSDSEMTALEEIAEEVADEWIEKMSADGVDAQELYDTYIENLEKYSDKIAK